MLIDVFAGRDRNSAATRGSFHFACSPKPGEHVEIDGAVLIVTSAWHRPDIYYRGAKFAILVDDPIARAETAIPIHDDAGSFCRPLIGSEVGNRLDERPAVL